MRESLIIVLGEDTPSSVVLEVKEMMIGCDMVVLPFSWDNEDNEDMPETAKYLSEKYNTYHCSIMIGGIL